MSASIEDTDAAGGTLNAALRFVDNPLPMWVYDLETLEIVDANDAALAFYGYERDELLGCAVTDLRPSAADRDLAPVESGDAALPPSVTRRHRRKDGSLVDVHVLSHPLTYRRRPAVLAVAQDVTNFRCTGDATAKAQRESYGGHEILVALSKELQAARTPEQAYAALTGHALVAASAAHAALVLLIHDGQMLTLAHTSGEPIPWPESPMPAASSRLGQAVRTGLALQWPAAQTRPVEPYVDDAAYRNRGPLAVIPIGPRDRTIGALVVIRPAEHSSAFAPADLHLLENAAGIALPAIQRARQARRLHQAYARTALALAQAIEMHGGEPGSRAARLTGLAAATAGALGCSVQEIEDVRWGARLYDIGMVAVPEEIAEKPKGLTEPEWAVVRQHPLIADEVLRSVAQLHRAATLVRHHQERWDGTGYPDGLRGSAIPLGARILGILEAYTAMSEPRAYRPARSRDGVVAELRKGAGTQFDPAVVDAFCSVLGETDVALLDRITGQPGAPPTRQPRPGLDDALLVALRALPDGARQLVRRLDIEDVELEVEEHLTRVGRWSVQLAKAAGLPPAQRALLAQAAFLHDVGKLSLSRALLRKPGRLSVAERALVAEHVSRGVALLQALEVSELVVAIVAAHHERWDGKGYPRGLAGEAIPLEARILAIADSFDAMTSPRVYHRARTFEDAAAELRREAGRQFDGRLVSLFVPLLYSNGDAAG